MIRNRLGDATLTDLSTGAKVATSALSLTTAASSAGLITLGATATAAIPIAGAVIGVGVLIYSFLHNSVGLQQDADTTAEVNKAAVLMQQNLDAWNASTKSYSTQTAAEANFDSLWSQVLVFCGNPAEGSPGQRCISERQRGGKYDFFSYYRDPIANDPDAGAPDRAAAAAAAAASASVASTAAQIASGSSAPQGTAPATAPAPLSLSGLPAWLIPAAIVAAIVVAA
jgi:hypothetical protein